MSLSENLHFTDTMPLVLVKGLSLRSEHYFVKGLASHLSINNLTHVEDIPHIWTDPLADT